MLPVALALLALAAGSARAQTPATLGAPVDFTRQPGRTVLGTLLPGAAVTPGRTSGSSVEVAFEGWIFSTSLAPMKREGFDVTVAKRDGENMRDSPDGAVRARIKANAGFVSVETRGRWTRVRRTAWIDAKALPAPSAAAPLGPDAAEITRRVPLLAAAGGDTLGHADSGTAARVLARAGGWSRVAVEAWVPDSVLRASEGSVLRGVTVAEVRANPARYVGKELEWRVQLVAVQKADELRPEIPAGRTYLLARGPLPEPGFVYIVLPPERVAEFEAMPSLREMMVRGRLRAAATRYLPTPVLDLTSVAEGQDSR
ncbi:MAG: hypothetical protein OEW80_01000 [Gemmatimonadota bacterium]|nr:hypothetical protein [Gemmatimonadota bacterium]